MMTSVAIATLTCCANSHPFQERRLTLAESIKIGRSVAQSRPAQTNAIFDCKVLSRNHALLWYDNGKFFLQDTKSSNGTFVNSQRLSKGSEESSPFEVFSQDTVQFGVDVMENSRKVTHSCIIATIRLFHPDGQEALSCNSAAGSSTNPAIRSQELCQLALSLQEALHREEVLEVKLATLQKLVTDTSTASDNSWQAMINEDRLLSRLDLLENQLNIFSKNQSEDSLQGELLALQTDKFNYENTAKESLRRVLEEKLEAVRKVSELERALSNSEQECSQLESVYQSTQQLLQSLVETNEQQSQELQQLTNKLEEVEKVSSDEKEKFLVEKQSLEEKLEQLSQQEQLLQAKIESLQADCDFTHEQLNNLKATLELSTKRISTSDTLPQSTSCGVQVELVNVTDLELLQQQTDAACINSCAPVSSLAVCQLISTSVSATDNVQQHAYNNLTDTDNERRRHGDHDQCLQLQQSAQEFVISLQKQLDDSQALCASRSSQISLLEIELEAVQQQLKLSSETLQPPIHELSTTCLDVVDSCNIDAVQQQMLREAASNRVEFAALKEECASLRQRIQDIELDMKRSNGEYALLKAEYLQLQESYRQLERIRDTLQDFQDTCQLNLTDAQKDADNTKSQLTSAEQELTRLRELCSDQQTAIDELNAQLQGTLDEYGTLAYQCRLLSTCSVAPLLLLLLAVIIAFCPALAIITATTTPPH